jgi:hypothetical protein
VRALGIDDDFRVTMLTLPVMAGDRFLLCTDGLSTTVGFDAIWRTLRAPGTPRDLAGQLLSQAIELGATDNVSLVLSDVSEVDLQEDYSTKRYNDIPDPPSVHPPPPLAAEDRVDSARFAGPEIVGSAFIASLRKSGEEGVLVSEELLELEAVEVPTSKT